MQLHPQHECCALHFMIQLNEVEPLVFGIKLIFTLTLNQTLSVFSSGRYNVKVNCQLHTLTPSDYWLEDADSLTKLLEFVTLKMIHFQGAQDEEVFCWCRKCVKVREPDALRTRVKMGVKRTQQCLSQSRGNLKNAQLPLPEDSSSFPLCFSGS